MTTDPTETALWQRLVQWQPADAALIVAHCRALPDDWPLRVFGVGRPEAAMLLPPAATGEQFPNRIPEIAPYDEIAALDDCPACEEAGGNCRFHAGYAAGYHELSEAQREAVKARPDITLRDFMHWQADVAEAEDRGEEPPLLPAAAPSPDRAGLRARIASALTAAAFECDGKCGLSEQECWDRHPIHLSAVSNGITHVIASVTAIADAVLKVLPSAADWDALVREADQLRREGRALQARAEEIDERMAALQQQVTEPTDRAAVLREAAEHLLTLKTPPNYIGVHGLMFANGVQAAGEELRRVAAEAPQQEPTDADVVEAHRLALSSAVGLGTGAPWDAIRDRAAELHGAEARQQETDDTDLTETDIDRMIAVGVPVQIATGPPATHGAGARQQPDTETWDVPDARPGTTDHTLTQRQQSDGWRGATEHVPDHEVQRLAATGLVGYQQDRGRLLHCLRHKPAPVSRCTDFHEVTADDLPDGGICVHWSCGADLLAGQAAADGEVTP